LVIATGLDLTVRFHSRTLSNISSRHLYCHLYKLWYIKLYIQLSRLPILILSITFSLPYPCPYSQSLRPGLPHRLFCSRSPLFPGVILFGHFLIFWFFWVFSRRHSNPFGSGRSLSPCKYKESLWSTNQFVIYSFCLPLSIYLSCFLSFFFSPSLRCSLKQFLTVLIHALLYKLGIDWLFGNNWKCEPNVCPSLKLIESMMMLFFFLFWWWKICCRLYQPGGMMIL